MRGCFACLEEGIVKSPVTRSGPNGGSLAAKKILGEEHTRCTVPHALHLLLQARTAEVSRVQNQYPKIRLISDAPNWGTPSYLRPTSAGHYQKYACFGECIFVFFDPINATLKLMTDMTMPSFYLPALPLSVRSKLRLRCTTHECDIASYNSPQVLCCMPYRVT